MNKIHIAKRDTLPLYINIAIRGGAIILALLVCALVTTVLTGENPLSIYGTILKGAFGTARKSWTTWENVAILLGISLAVTPAFKMRFWNIGAEGQVLIGCLASATCMITLGDKIPNGLLLVIMFVASLGMGALWGFLPGLFKARWNTNETLFTLMMNYIATQLVAYFIIIWEVPKGAGKIGIINQDSQAGWLPTIGNQKYLLAILASRRSRAFSLNLRRARRSASPELGVRKTHCKKIHTRTEFLLCARLFMGLKSVLSANPLPLSS